MEKETEVKPAEVLTPVIRNEADDANDLSVTSVSLLPEKADMEKVESEAAHSSEAKPEDKKELPQGEKQEEKKDPVQRRVEKIEEKQKDAQKRIDEATKKRRQVERELESANKSLAEKERELEEIKKKLPATGKPKMEDFETEEAFLEALTDWKIEQKTYTEKERAFTVSKEQFEKDRVSATTSAVNDVVKRGSLKYKDFEDVVLDDDLRVSSAMRDVIIESDIADDLLYYFGKNPDISADIAEMRPIQAAREIGKIEAKLLTSSTKKTTNAPEPITPLKTSGIIEKDPEKMTMAEYKIWFKQHQKK